MSIRIPIVLIALNAACLAAGDNAVVRFSNGDQLTGEALSLSGDKLTWKSQLLKEPSEFDLRHIVDLNMPAGNAVVGDSGAAHKAVLAMTNGDLIEGRLAGLSDDEIILKTSYAGVLTIRRVNVKSVSISRSSDYIYRGPNSLEEWTLSGSGSWQFRGGALHSKSPGGIAREVDFPDECVIAFDATWRGAFRAKIIFFSNDVTSPNPDAGYEMVFQGNSVHLKKCGSNNWLGHSPNAGALRENEKARIEIRASNKNGKILLYLDGEVVGLWEDADVAAGKFGTGFHIVAQDSSMLRISNIGIGEWDGYHEEVPNQQAGGGGRVFRGGFEFGEEQSVEDESEEEPAEGRMALVNGDSIEGEVVKVDGDDITLKTPFAEVTFPIVRLKNLVRKKVDMETVKLYKGDVRATFEDGSRLVFRFDGVDGDKVLGYSQHFGEARFSKDSLSKIEFNIYDKKMESMRLRDEW
jgi:hypothetical protein